MFSVFLPCHFSPFQKIPNAGLVSCVQDATNSWWELAQAMGNALNQSTCSAYFLLYKFVNEKTQLKNLKELPKYNGEVLLDDGEVAPPTLPLRNLMEQTDIFPHCTSQTLQKSWEYISPQLEMILNMWIQW